LIQLDPTSLTVGDRALLTLPTCAEESPEQLETRFFGPVGDSCDPFRISQTLLFVRFLGPINESSIPDLVAINGLRVA
jgi:hypothetical protein